MNRVIYNYAISMLGLPYIWGGDDSIEGFDCSGLVIELLKADGLLPNSFDTTSQGLYDKYITSTKHFRKVHKLEKLTPEFGRLCFYGKSPTNITHVAMCLDNELVIEAGGGGSSIKTKEDAVKRNAFVRVRPYDYRRDLIDILIPFP